MVDEGEDEGKEGRGDVVRRYILPANRAWQGLAFRQPLKLYLEITFRLFVAVSRTENNFAEPFYTRI